MVMPSRSCSSGMQSIRRELQRRRPKPLAPKRSVITKQSAPSQPPPPHPQLQKDPSSAAAVKSPPGSVATHAPRPPLPRPTLHRVPLPSLAPRRRLRAAPPHPRPGTEVGVRTRTTNLKIGKVLVLWLRATIASQTNGGYGVVYDGNWPPVYVPRRYVRKIQPSPSPTTPPPSLPPSCAPSSSAAAAATLKKEMRPPSRPTTAGKSLRLIRRSLLPEMEGKNQAALLGY
ncbi:unnamed protein product [Urochloa decumbens]|uniref:Uncharacterized protein n=1 Tax=Urochloa decumbens TaxID=240449 RepID=A0ABC9G6C3_9POAL